jgi:hypothetical protein
MAQTPKPVEIDTATLAKPIGRTVAIRIGGTVYEAHCPKDAVLARIQRDGTNTIDVITDVITAMIGRDGGEEVAGMLADGDNDEVSIGTLSQMIQYLMDNPDGPQWANALTENLKALGSGETPRTIPMKRGAPARAPRAKRR